ncbi:MAG TPA: S26 family signal peptidase [Tepidisphaeraceae bacterium]|nr:S26 family signal peptidase [Tepidisphaeraceae bacterium]
MTQPATSPSPAPAAPAGRPAGAAAASSPVGGRKKVNASQESNVKETIESILVAFILAFIFRAFVVEAFVIPTGSMAPTLMGAHMRFRCNDCGYRFESNYSATQNAQNDLIIKSQSDLDYRVICPNCSYKFPAIDPANPDNDGTRPPVQYGDRILVLKYLYLLGEPQRWDVVVFKSPANDDPRLEKPTYQQNYIKRLIGTPGESIMILDGDIYKGAPAADKTTYTVQTKPRHAQGALWRVVYDNDYHPQGLERGDGSHFRQPWTVRQGAGWSLGSTAADGRTFRFDNASGAATLFFDRDANPKANRAIHAFTDWLAYDLEQEPPNNVVKDLKLAFHYERQAGEGPLRVNLSDGRQTFAAILAPGEAKLVQLNSDGERIIGAAKIPAGGDPLRVELTNVDYQVTLRVNEETVAQTTPEQYRPDVVRLLADYGANRPQPPPGVEIAAANQTAALSHIGLWRDIYYLNGSERQQFIGSPRNVINLGAGEYYVLGDNSLISGDARYWTSPIELPADRLSVPAGRVPSRFLLGRAFFVYWPAGYRPAPGLPALSPNFGDMRFIR